MTIHQYLVCRCGVEFCTDHSSQTKCPACRKKSSEPDDPGKVPTNPGEFALQGIYNQAACRRCGSREFALVGPYHGKSFRKCRKCGYWNPGSRVTPDFYASTPVA